jgi:hypothetical protein
MVFMPKKTWGILLAWVALVHQVQAHPVVSNSHTSITQVTINSSCQSSGLPCGTRTDTVIENGKVISRTQSNIDGKSEIISIQNHQIIGNPSTENTTGEQSNPKKQFKLPTDVGSQAWMNNFMKRIPGLSGEIKEQGKPQVHQVKQETKTKAPKEEPKNEAKIKQSQTPPKGSNGRSKVEEEKPNHQPSPNPSDKGTVGLTEEPEKKAQDHLINHPKDQQHMANKESQIKEQKAAQKDSQNDEQQKTNKKNQIDEQPTVIPTPLTASIVPSKTQDDVTHPTAPVTENTPTGQSQGASNDLPLLNKGTVVAGSEDQLQKLLQTEVGPVTSDNLKALFLGPWRAPIRDFAFNSLLFLVNQCTSSCLLPRTLAIPP